jgi:hypothetical protein
MVILRPEDPARNPSLVRVRIKFDRPKLPGVRVRARARARVSVSVSVSVSVRMRVSRGDG